MANGSRRTRGTDGYVFVDGRAMRADEVVRITLDSSDVPGQDAAATVPGAAEAQAQMNVPGAKPASKRKSRAEKKAAKGDDGKPRSAARDALTQLENDDAFALRDDALEGAISLRQTEGLMADDRRKMRVKYLAFGIALLVVALFSFCISGSYDWKIYAPSEVIQAVGQWFTMVFTQITDPNSYSTVRREVLSNPAVNDIVAHAGTVFKYVLCGALLAVAGMLYQNTFRNPIAAPSMLGVSSGISLALLILVLVFGAQAASQVGLYFLFTYAGGALILILVLLGGKFVSGKHRFNVVNMILIGTVVSQLLGVITTYIQNVFITDEEWLVYSKLQAAAGVTSTYTWISLLLGFAVAFVPIFLFRFKLNLVSFSDSETRLLGVDPNKLRVLALVCGSFMVLTAQVNTGQVAMASLVVPFVVRAVFGAEFRKQLYGNILVGALVILVCGDISDYVLLFGTEVDLGSIVNIVVLPLFVWMLAIRQRSWE